MSRWQIYSELQMNCRISSRSSFFSILINKFPVSLTMMSLPCTSSILKRIRVFLFASRTHISISLFLSGCSNIPKILRYQFYHSSWLRTGQCSLHFQNFMIIRICS
jgi:hypothetical protein